MINLLYFPIHTLKAKCVLVPRVSLLLWAYDWDKKATESMQCSVYHKQTLLSVGNYSQDLTESMQ